MKDNPINIGFDDATFDLKSGSNHTRLIGVVCQGVRMVKVIGKKIEIDGDDSTSALIELINQERKHVQYVLTDTITFGGFNIADLENIYNETEKPIIAITEREIDLDSVKTALINKFPDTYETKFQHIFNAGNIYETEIQTAGGQSKVFFHAIGIEIAEVEALLDKVCIDSKLPESVRLAHLIGKLFEK